MPNQWPFHPPHPPKPVQLSTAVLCLPSRFIWSRNKGTAAIFVHHGFCGPCCQRHQIIKFGKTLPQEITPCLALRPPNYGARLQKLLVTDAMAAINRASCRLETPTFWWSGWAEVGPRCRPPRWGRTRSMRVDGRTHIWPLTGVWERQSRNNGYHR